MSYHSKFTIHQNKYHNTSRHKLMARLSSKYITSINGTSLQFIKTKDLIVKYEEVFGIKPTF